MKRKKCLKVRWCNDFGHMSTQVESRVSPGPYTEEGRINANNIEHRQPARQGIDNR